MKARNLIDAIELYPIVGIILAISAAALVVSIVYLLFEKSGWPRNRK